MDKGKHPLPLLPLDGSSHNLSQSKIKICWKTEKTQFTAQAHANPQNIVCVFRLSLKSQLDCDILFLRYKLEKMLRSVYSKPQISALALQQLQAYQIPKIIQISQPLQPRWLCPLERQNLSIFTKCLQTFFGTSG